MRWADRLATQDDSLQGLSWTPLFYAGPPLGALPAWANTWEADPGQWTDFTGTGYRPRISVSSVVNMALWSIGCSLALAGNGLVAQSSLHTLKAFPTFSGPWAATL
eukprot:6366372-Amphidinium_carterae.1